jgi:hypothetical protein
MDPLTLASDPLPGLLVLLFSLAWLAKRRFRTDALIDVLGSVEPEARFIDRT